MQRTNHTKNTLIGFFASAMLWAGLASGSTIYVPNSSFESPAAPQVNPYAGPDLDYWQKAPQPSWYYPSNNFDTPWEDLMGAFFNVPYPGTFIDNCDGMQASFLFALPDAALFQDYDTIYGTNTVPSHAFNAKFHPGRAYNLTVGLIGGGGNMQPGATFELSLYYRDAGGNLVPVAVTTVTNSPDLFPTNTHFVDFQVHVPTVHASDAWAGKNIGIKLASTVGFDIAGGYWDVDNVRLSEVIEIPNGSFESPVVPPVNPYAQPDMDYWQKSAQPAWYYPSNNFDTPWDYLMGEFYNVPFPGTFIDNCDGAQAAFIFAVPDAAIFQDYDTVYGAITTPSHAFNVLYTPGKRYTVTAGFIGGGGNMQSGVTIQLGLYYRDANSNLVTIATTTVTNSPTTFLTNTHFVDFQARLPGVQVTDASAGKNIGIQLLSTATFFNAGGYWDVENVRLLEETETELLNVGLTNGHFQATLMSEPGLKFEIQSAANPGSTASWSSLATITNVSGTTVFVDSAIAIGTKFYRARQVP